MELPKEHESAGSAGISEHVDDCKLDTVFLPNETSFQHRRPLISGRPSTRQRFKTETWERVKCLGQGGFGSVWLEENKDASQGRQLRAVKQLPKKATGRSAQVDYGRELEAITKFSREKV